MRSELVVVGSPLGSGAASLEDRYEDDLPRVIENQRTFTVSAA
jgi:hypothetical protein